MEANYYSDDCVEQEEDGVDNSELKYDNQKIFIRLNDRRNLFEARRNSLNICAKELKKKFPQMGAYKDDEIFQKIIKELNFRNKK